MERPDNVPDFFHNGYVERVFETHLRPLADKPQLTFCQIGAYAGDASVWLFENILTDLTALLFDVDTWEGGPDFDDSDVDFEAVESFYNFQLNPYRGHLVKRKLTASNFFSFNASSKFDFIYIDGNHAADEVLFNAVDAWRHLLPGGMMAFDDYHWHTDRGEFYEPMRGIDAFLSVFANQLEVIEYGDQLWIRRDQ